MTKVARMLSPEEAGFSDGVMGKRQENGCQEGIKVTELRFRLVPFHGPGDRSNSYPVSSLVFRLLVATSTSPAILAAKFKNTRTMNRLTKPTPR